jgi:hypothetical protein
MSLKGKTIMSIFLQKKKRYNKMKNTTPIKAVGECLYNLNRNNFFKC